MRFCFPWFYVKSANDQNKEVTKLIEPSSGLIFKECDIKGITFNNFILFYSEMWIFCVFFFDANVARNLIRKYSYPLGCVKSLFVSYDNGFDPFIHSFLLLFIVSHQKSTFYLDELQLASFNEKCLQIATV